MKKNLYRIGASVLAAVSVMASLSSVALAAEDMTVEGKRATKVYQFQTETDKDLSYDGVEKELTVGRKTFVLEDVQYEVIEHVDPVAVTKTVTAQNQSDYDKEITEKIDGKDVRLIAKEPEWKELATEKEEREYASEAEVLQSIMVDGKTYHLSETTAGSKAEPFSAPAAFRAPTDTTTLFEFNGKIVEITGEPTWSGYEADVAAYLGVNGNEYQITGASWDGGFVQSGDEYVRTAIFTGVRNVPVYTATYEADEKYSAEITYVDGVHPDGWYEVKATATYTLKNDVVMTIVKVGAGALVLAGAAAAIIAVLKKKKKNEKQ